jgi:hypothetical protein
MAQQGHSKNVAHDYFPDIERVIEPGSVSEAPIYANASRGGGDRSGVFAIIAEEDESVKK